MKNNKITQSTRLVKLNKVAISQMKSILGNTTVSGMIQLDK